MKRARRSVDGSGTRRRRLRNSFEFYAVLYGVLQNEEHGVMPLRA